MKFLNRRDFLRDSLSLGLAARVGASIKLPLSLPEARGSGAAARRLIMIYYPNGAVLRRWHPEDSSRGRRLQRGSSLSFALDPLAPLADRLVAFRGMNTLGHGGSSSHPEAASQILSGGNVGQASIEVAIAAALAENFGVRTPFKHVHLGLFTRYNKGKEYLVFRDLSGKSILPEDDPLKAARLLFGESTGAGEPEPRRSDLASLRLERLSQIERDLGRLKQDLLCCPGSQAETKIAVHLQSTQRYAERLRSGSPNVPARCAPKNIPQLKGDKRLDNEIAESIVRAQWKNIIGASLCDITRVFGFSFMSAQDDSLFINFESIKALLDSSDGGGFGSDKKWWNRNQSHSSSHEANEVFGVQNRWYNMMVSELALEMDSVQDPLGGGSLLDTSLICVFSENGESANHGQEDVAWYLLGGAGGRLHAGQVLHCDGRGTSDLLLSIAKLMGLEWNAYARSSGAIPGLIV